MDVPTKNTLITPWGSSHFLSSWTNFIDKEEERIIIKAYTSLFKRVLGKKRLAITLLQENECSHYKKKFKSYSFTKLSLLEKIKLPIFVSAENFSILIHSKKQNIYTPLSQIGMPQILKTYYNFLYQNQNRSQKNLLPQKFSQTGFFIHLALNKSKFLRIQGKKTSFEKIKKDLLKIFKEERQDSLYHKVHIENINVSNFKKYQDEIEALERNSYEESRRYSAADYFNVMKQTDCFSIGIFCKNQLISYSMSVPMNYFKDDETFKEHPYLHKKNHHWMYATTVHPSFQGKGLGKLIKYLMTLYAGEIGVEALHSRTRDITAKNMLMINASLGALEFSYKDNYYQDNIKPRGVIYNRSKVFWKKKKPLLFAKPYENYPYSFLQEKDIALGLELLTQKQKKISFYEELISSFTHPSHHSFFIKNSHCLFQNFLHQKVLIIGQDFYPYFSQKKVYSSFVKQKEIILNTLKSQTFDSIIIEPISFSSHEQIPPEELNSLIQMAKENHHSVILNQTLSSFYYYDTKSFFCNTHDFDFSYSFLGPGICHLWSKTKKESWEESDNFFSLWMLYKRIQLQKREEYLDVCQKFDARILDIAKKKKFKNVSMRNGLGSYQYGKITRLNKYCKHSYKNRKYLICASYDNMKQFLDTPYDKL